MNATRSSTASSQGVYVTGSVMKGLTAIAALESGVYDEDSRYHCVGTLGLRRRYPLRLAGPAGTASCRCRQASPTAAIPFSTKPAFRLNAKDPWALPSYARLTGPGPAHRHQPDPRDPPAMCPRPTMSSKRPACPGLIRTPSTLSIGQGEVQASPLQMARLYAAIANGGYLLRPQLVRERGILDQRSPVARRDVMRETGLDPDNLAIIRRGLCDVSRQLTAERPRINSIGSPLLDVGVCGKTGTAQVPGEDKLPHSWFIAYAPSQSASDCHRDHGRKCRRGFQSVAAPLTRRISWSTTTLERVESTGQVQLRRTVYRRTGLARHEDRSTAWTSSV